MTPDSTPSSAPHAAAEARPAAEAPQGADASSPPAAPPPLPPSLRTPLAPDAVLESLDRASRKGKLPGLRLDRAAHTFALSDFGRPFESVLTGTIAPDAPPAAGSRIHLHSRVKPTLPIIYAVILVVTIWPGILLTDSMLKLYFSWYTIPTWWWYLPLTVPFSPWAWWKAWKQSRTSAAVEGAELVSTLTATLDGIPDAVSGLANPPNGA